MQRDLVIEMDCQEDDLEIDRGVSILGNSISKVAKGTILVLDGLCLRGLLLHLHPLRDNREHLPKFVVV